MKNKKNSRLSLVVLILIIFIGAYLRFHKLDWGNGYFFHPDEYHITAAVDRLNFPTQMNPELFSYGSFTVYLVYFGKILAEVFIGPTSSIHPILIGRFFSALFSTLTILVIYLISRAIFERKLYRYLSTLLVALTPGVVQQAHFATPESILTFWILLTLLFWIKWLNINNLKFLLFSAVALGLAIGTKIVALTFLPILILLPFVKLKTYWPSKIPRQISLTLLLLFITSLVFLLVFPFSLLDKKGFLHSMNYETSVAQGNLLVFYTRQFINTLPVTFQFTKIFPFALGPAILVIGSFGGILMVFDFIASAISKRQQINLKLLVILSAFLTYLIPNLMMFAKWTRFLAPSFSFFSIFAVYSISYLAKKKKPSYHFTSSLLTIVVVAVTSLWTLMFFSIYRKTDVRLSATEWISQNVAANSFILTEQGNMLEVPLSGSYKKEAFDFYNLDQKITLQSELPHLLLKADYFTVQSRRIFINHQRLAGEYPQTARFYQKLFSGELGFTKLKEFNSFPSFKINGWSYEIDDELAEETWSVFDHPVVRIYKKTNPLTLSEYQTLLQI